MLSSYFLTLNAVLGLHFESKIISYQYFRLIYCIACTNKTVNMLKTIDVFTYLCLNLSLVFVSDFAFKIKYSERNNWNNLNNDGKKTSNKI